MAVGSSVLVSGLNFPIATGDHHPGPMIAFLATALIGAAVVLGLWTPVAAALAALVNLTDTLSLGLRTGPFSEQSAPIGILLVLVSLALIMLGPGAFSADARLFGQREIVIPELPPDADA